MCCRVRSAQEADYEFSHIATMDRLLKKGCSPKEIFESIRSQVCAAATTENSLLPRGDL